MNPIDMTFEEKVEQVTKANRIPSGQGFNFLRFQDWSTSDRTTYRKCSRKRSSIPRIGSRIRCNIY